MKFKKKLSLLIVISLFITLLSHSGIANAATNKFDSRVTSEISQLKDNEKMRVYIWLNDYTDKEVSDRLLTEYNLKAGDYDDYNEFMKKIYLPTANAVIRIVGKEKAYASGEKSDIDSKSIEALKQQGLYESEDTSASLIERAVSIKTDYFSEARRKILESICSEKISFMRKSLSLKETVFQGTIVPMVIADVTREQLHTLNELRVVSDISYYEEYKTQSDLDVCLPQIHADASTGTNSSSYHLSGTGIKIGILEFSNDGTGRFDTTCPHLSGIPSSRLIYVNNKRSDGTYVPNSTGSHATSVTCMVAGQLYDGRQGVVPDATIYQTTYATTADFYTGVDALYNKGVNIITHSASADVTSYTDQERYVDKFIVDSNITFLNSVGNRGNGTTHIGTPAKAYNAIAVGSLQTKVKTNNGSHVAAPKPYSVSASSSTYTLSYLANKPDVVAPGESIYFSKNSTTVTISSGTSLSTPLVAGVVAQLMQKKPFLKSQPNYVKNYILSGASNDNITNTTINHGFLTEESGAGLVNALKTINASNLYNSNTAGGAYSYSSGNSWSNDASFYLSSGQKIRIVLTYQKEEDNLLITSNYGNDMDLRLVYNNGSSISTKATSTSSNNNVETIEYTATISGTYSIQTRLFNSILTSGGNDDLHYFISWIIE